ncbi:hypothetical protein BDR04DRAFT_993168, partial [Suillus decipiens]
IFGILKQCFRILHLSPEYKMDIQAHSALCVLHNFIRIHDPSKDPLPPLSVVNDNPIHQGDVTADESRPDVQAANTCHDCIATHMWEDYE